MRSYRVVSKAFSNNLKISKKCPTGRNGLLNPDEQWVVAGLIHIEGSSFVMHLQSQVVV